MGTRRRGKPLTRPQVVKFRAQRAELFVIHDARAFRIAAKSHCRRDVGDFLTGPVLKDKSLSSCTAAWQGVCMTIPLDHKNGFHGRFVVGDLSPSEAEQWIGRLPGRLDVPCGQLVLPGHLLHVPSGKYDVDVLAYFPGQTAFQCAAKWRSGTYEIQEAELPQFKRESLGSYFRRTRPGQEFPGWLKWVCADDSQADPEMYEQWGRLRASWTRAEQQAMQDARRRCIDLVIHLTAVSEFTPYQPPANEFWPWQVRQPAMCPLGLEQLWQRHGRHMPY